MNAPKRVLLLFFLGILSLLALFKLNSANDLLIVFVLYAFISTICHTLVLHRYFSHSSFKVSNPLHWLFSFFSVLAGMGSPITYRFDHRLHHKFSDTKNDIHGPGTGFFRAVLSYKTEENISANSKDALINFIHKNYYILFSCYLLLSYLVFGFEITCYLSLAIWLNILIAGDLFNYTTHLKFFGTYRNFNTNECSTNHMLWGIFGSNWHNNHHRYPARCNEQVKWWEIDWLYQLVIRWIKT